MAVVRCWSRTAGSRIWTRGIAGLPRVQIPFPDRAWSGHEDVTTFQNVVYSVEILYPEAMFELICLNLLIERRHAFHS